MGQLQSQNCLYLKMYLRLGLGIRVSSIVKVMVRVGFKIRCDDLVAVPASDHSAELSPEQDSNLLAKAYSLTQGRTGNRSHPVHF